MALRIVVCAKEVLDPDAVNNYALEGKLVIGDDGKSLTQSSIPRLMNAYDEQAIEAALRIREAGVALHDHGRRRSDDGPDILKHAASLGRRRAGRVSRPTRRPRSSRHRAACWRPASGRAAAPTSCSAAGRRPTTIQGVVPALLARAPRPPRSSPSRAPSTSRRPATAFGVRVVRVTPDGDETVAVAAPAVVTISNELGEARYPTMAGRMAARKKKITAVTSTELGVAAEVPAAAGHAREAVRARR